MLLKVLLASSLIGVVKLNCGCNEFNRQEIEERSTKSSKEDSFIKVCEAKVRNANNHYRDYYSYTKETAKHDKEPGPKPVSGMSFIPGGEYFIGTNKPHFIEDHESPERLIVLKDFYIDKYEVSNADFQQFVVATNYTTEAETFGDSFVFKSLLSQDQREALVDFRVVNALWWYKVKGASWRKPHGPNSNLEGLWDHPVVHVSWNDAVAYCQWKGRRLPSEAEWEAACRGGKKRKLFPWGNKLMPKDKHWLNIWQGDFPDGNYEDDGYSTTCPVHKFRQNNFDVYNIVGNVWEWTQDMWQENVRGERNPKRVKKGGSYLCHESYCYRYRCAARSQNTADSSAGNLGFRCVQNI